MDFEIIIFTRSVRDSKTKNTLKHCLNIMEK